MHFFKSQKDSKGFSLLEVIVTVAILAVCTAVLVPSYLHLSNSSRYKKDIAKFESISLALKEAITEPEVVKEMGDFGDTTIDVVFYMNEEGLIEFGKGLVVGSIERDMDSTELWDNLYQSIEVTHTTSSPDHRDKYVVYEVVPKTPTSTAKCTYEIVDSYP